MKIAIFTDCYLDLTGGITTNINIEKQELEKRGHTVYVFSSAYPRTKQQIIKLAKENIFPVPSCKHILRGITPVARRPRIIEKWLDQNHSEIKDFDIFYIHYEAGASIAGLRYARQHHIPTVQVMHGREDVGEANLVPLGLRTIVATLLNWFHSWYLPHPAKVHRDNYLATTLASAKMWTLMVNHANYADLIITPSKHFAKKLHHYGVKRQIIPLAHGMPDNLCTKPHRPRVFTPQPSPNPTTPEPTSTHNNSTTPESSALHKHSPLRLIWHSRVSGEKRIMVFLKALRQVTGKYQLDVYGDGNDLKKAKRYAQRHQLNVIFHGVAKFPAIYQQIEKSHLDVLVSYNFDTFGMTLIEAESAGTPVLIADPDLREVAPEGGYILSATPSATSIADAINSLFSHPEKIRQMSEIMLRDRPRITISHKIDQLEQIFIKLRH
ncbi:glycosyltransferase [Candidatus Saccharibacteria bacterium]|nr:glycosyltransferase [Candidatus Saccharibacteria bacterium]